MTHTQAQLTEVSVSFALNATEPERWVMADRHRLLQVLLNLLSNAIKYNRVGGQVELSVVSDSASDWRIEVADTGVGISDELADKLFSPFARAEDTQVDGTGLGLAVSKSLIEAMQGELGWSARPHEGSIFWFTLGRVDPQ
jgi:signal transduction histidine kinase